jgi:hypothetical protein
MTINPEQQGKILFDLYSSWKETSCHFNAKRCKPHTRTTTRTKTPRVSTPPPINLRDLHNVHPSPAFADIVSVSNDKIKNSQLLIVIDAFDVAIRHGKGRGFSCQGLQLCMAYFMSRGHRVLAFIPDYCLDQRKAIG